MSITKISSQRSFEGYYSRFSHESAVLGCQMTFGVYLPPNVEAIGPPPVLYWLPDQGCTDEDFMTDVGALRFASKLGIVIVALDSTPRLNGAADKGAIEDSSFQYPSFYINATEEPWSKNYQMHDYVVKELPDIIEKNFFVSSKRGISGHLMGGHGALICALRNPGLYTSVSAFSPISNPIDCTLGRRAFTQMLGKNEEKWREWDTCALITSVSRRLPLMIDQGASDELIHTQLKPGNLAAAASLAKHHIDIRVHYGYDSSTFFVTTFIDDHLRHHAEKLRGTQHRFYS